MTRQTGNNDIKDVEDMFSLKFAIIFWRIPKMPIINCEISLILTWQKNCFLVTDTVANQQFTMTDKTLCFSRNFINSK